MKEKVLLSFILVLVIVSALTMHFLTQTDDANEIGEFEEGVDMLIAIYHGGIQKRSYRFIISNDKTLDVSFGERKKYNVTSTNFFKRIEERKDTVLSEEAYTNILLLSEKIISTKEGERKPLDDGWEITMLTKDITYEMNLIPTSEITMELVELLKDNSPISVTFDAYPKNQ